MKAWIVEHVGGPEVLTLADIPAPQAKADEVKIRVRAFGLNRAEVYRRTGMMGPIDSPVVPGIEAVGGSSRTRPEPSARANESPPRWAECSSRGPEATPRKSRSCAAT